MNLKDAIFCTAGDLCAHTYSPMYTCVYIQLYRASLYKLSGGGACVWCATGSWLHRSWWGPRSGDSIRQKPLLHVLWVLLKFFLSLFIETSCPQTLNASASGFWAQGLQVCITTLMLKLFAYWTQKHITYFKVTKITNELFSNSKLISNVLFL